MTPLPVATIFKKMKKLTTIFAVLFLCYTCPIQAQQVKGLVLDSETKAPLWGASIQVEGVQKGTISDSKGNFSLSNLPANTTLVVSFVGYEPKQISVTNAEKILLNRSNFLQDEVIVKATRADENSAMAFSDVGAKTLNKNNLGQDMPVLLQFTPSVVMTSDAGAGVGYTGIRIRGSDATRVNVTINGIPVNDSESQGTYWVNMPDFASSVQSVQIQRGVGTSTNGAGAFGGSVNMQTNEFKEKSFGEILLSGGSFGTLKSTIKVGSGLLAGKFTVDGRLSRIVSNGYIDRASSNLQSAYISGAYFGKNSLLRLNYFTGLEKTYQSWYGTPESRVTGSLEGMQGYIDRNYLSADEAKNLLSSGRTYNYYTYLNQIDHYAQDHLQLLTHHRLSPNWDLDLNAHYTYGRGYYEEFKPDVDVANYGLKPRVFPGGLNIVRQKWLDNDFYGSTFALRYEGSKTLRFTLGGAWNRYEGRHFGKIISGNYLPAEWVNYEWYRSRSQKTDLNLYGKMNVEFHPAWNAYVDLQYRGLGYTMAGIADKRQDIGRTLNYDFFNPKVGLTHVISPNAKLFTSYSLGSTEPSRQDFIDNPSRAPRPEFLRVWELGYQQRFTKFGFQFNAYWMQYEDQLVLTGALNSVGEAIRTNAPESYRMGVEASWNYQIHPRWLWQGNVTLSQNKIRNFTEYVTDYDTYEEKSVAHGLTDIAYSPSLIAGSTMTYLRGAWEASLLSKMVGKQFLDNTSTNARSLPAYATQDVRVAYAISKKIRATLLANNVMNTLYASNGYTYSYLYAGDLTTENFQYPQAGFNFLVGLQIHL